MITPSSVFTLLFEVENALLQPDDACCESLARRVRHVTVRVVDVDFDVTGTRFPTFLIWYD